MIIVEGNCVKSNSVQNDCLHLPVNSPLMSFQGKPSELRRKLSTRAVEYNLYTDMMSFSIFTATCRYNVLGVHQYVCIIQQPSCLYILTHISYQYLLYGSCIIEYLYCLQNSSTHCVPVPYQVVYSVCIPGRSPIIHVYMQDRRYHSRTNSTTSTV